MDLILTAAAGQGELLAMVFIIVLAVGGSLLAGRLQVPSIVVLLILGLLVGPVLGLLDPDELLGDLLFPVVSLAVGVILFEGGLLLNLDEIDKDVGTVVRRLLTIGAIVTFVGSTAAGYYILDLELRIAALLGAICVVSGPTVVLPLLRFIKPRGRVAESMKWEGIFIDPVGAILAVLVFEAILAGEQRPGFGAAALQLSYSFAAGLIVGLAASIVLVALLRTYEIDESLQPAATLMLVLGAFAISDAWRAESGLIATLVMGMVVANQKRVPVQRITEFKETLGQFLTSVLFIVLAARLTIDELEAAIGFWELVFLGALVVVVRPLGVLLATLRSDHSWGERAFLASMAPRGVVAAAVASLFGLQLVEEGVPDADLLAPLTFFVILGTALIAGVAGMPVARRLGISKEGATGTLVVGGGPVSQEIARGIAELGSSVTIAPGEELDIKGMKVYSGHLLDDLEHSDLDFDDYSNVIVASPSDEYNSIVATQIAEEVGRARVFQIAIEDGGGPDQPDKRGRPLFESRITYQQLERRLEENGDELLVTRSNEQGRTLFLPPEQEEGATELARWREDGLQVIANDDFESSHHDRLPPYRQFLTALGSAAATVWESLVRVTRRERRRGRRKREERRRGDEGRQD